jgi:hypothetical protein
LTTRCWCRSAVVLLDVELEVVRLGDRSETRGQHREGGDVHVVATISDLGAASTMCRSHDLGSGLVIHVRNRTFKVSVVRLVLGTSPVLKVMAVALLKFDDAVNGA